MNAYMLLYHVIALSGCVSVSMYHCVYVCVVRNIFACLYIDFRLLLQLGVYLELL